MKFLKFLSAFFIVVFLSFTIDAVIENNIRIWTTLYILNVVLHGYNYITISLYLLKPRNDKRVNEQYAEFRIKDFFIRHPLKWE